MSSVAVLGFFAAASASADTAVITNLASPVPAGTSWGTVPGENTGTVAITDTAARSGNGSLEITGDRTRAQTGVQFAPFTTNIGLLDNTQSLTFDWQVAGDSSRLDYTPALRLLVQDANQRSELIWEGVYNAGAAPGTQANLNAAGTWYSTSANDLFWQQVAGVGPNETGGSLQLHTIAEWAALYSNPNAFVSGISVGAGSGATAGYHGFIDNVTYATTSGSTTYNFETAATGAVPEPATWAMMLVGFGAMGASLRSRRQRASVRFA